jgi:hypothetical protein
MMSERWRCKVEKGGGGGRKQVMRTGLVRCERVIRLHVPVLKELWLSDEPKRNVCIFVTVLCDVLKRRTMVHFRNTCCTGRSDLAKSGKSELRWSISNRFVYIRCCTRIHCQYLTKTEHRYFCRHTCLLCLISIEVVLQLLPVLPVEFN